MMVMVTILLYLWSLAVLSRAGNNTNAPSNNKLDDCTEWMDSAAQLKCNTDGGFCEIDANLMAMCTKTNRQSSSINIKMNGVHLVDIYNETRKTYQCRVLTAANEISTMATQIARQVPTIMTTQAINSSQAEQCITSIGLGAVVGLLVMLLAVVTTGWMWTCWIMRRQARIITNSKNISNPSYGGDQLTLQNHPLPTPTPTYETIPPLNNFMDGIKLDLAEPEERIDVNNNRESRAQRDDKKRESTDQTHKSGHREGYQERVTESSNGTGLQEIQHNYTSTSTKLLLDSALPGEEGKSVNLVDIGKAFQKNETVNSSVKKDNTELDGTTLEHDQTEMSEKEQYLPKKRAAARDYELAVPSK